MITYLEGDATQPVGDGPRIVAHICNDIGGWGKGFDLAVSRRWRAPEWEYRAWHSQGQAQLGKVLTVPVGDQIHVANMIGQAGIKSADGSPTVRYDAVRECLRTVREKALVLSATVHMPRIGCGLGGGSWDQMAPIIESELEDVEVYVYDFHDTRSVSYVAPRN